MPHIEYMCKFCGSTAVRDSTAGRPFPGSCPRREKTRDGKAKPHSWVVNRRF